MQQCGEPCMLTSSRRLAHGCQPIRRGAPAQCPGRGRPAAVSLGRGPSLHSLRRERAPIVRPLLRYYYLVRLLIRVHGHLRAVAFMTRPGSPPGADEISQVPYKRRHRMHGVYDCAGPAPCKPFAQGAVLPSLQQNEIDAPELDPVPFSSGSGGRRAGCAQWSVAKRGTARASESAQPSRTEPPAGRTD